MSSITIAQKQDWSVKRTALSVGALGAAMLFGMAIGSMPALTQSSQRISMAALGNAQPATAGDQISLEDQARQTALRQLAAAMKTMPLPAINAEAPKPAEAPAPAAMDPQDMQKLAGKAAEAIRLGDIASARLVLEHAVRAGDATALYALAETYDPRVLVKLRVQGMQGEPETARQLYQQALDRGVEEARSRL